MGDRFYVVGRGRGRRLEGRRGRRPVRPGRRLRRDRAASGRPTDGDVHGRRAGHAVRPRPRAVRAGRVRPPQEPRRGEPNRRRAPGEHRRGRAGGRGLEPSPTARCLSPPYRMEGERGLSAPPSLAQEPLAGLISEPAVQDESKLPRPHRDRNLEREPADLRLALAHPSVPIEVRIEARQHRQIHVSERADEPRPVAGRVAVDTRPRFGQLQQDRDQLVGPGRGAPNSPQRVLVAHLQQRRSAGLHRHF